MNQTQITTEVLKNASSKKRDAIEMEWMRYMTTHLNFPFEAEVRLYDYSTVLADGDIVKIVGLDDIIDQYGMIMKIKKGRKTLFCPLAELTVRDEESENFRIINAYEEWEANN